MDQHVHELNASRCRVKSALGRLNTPPKEQVLPEFRSNRRAQSANSVRGMSSSMAFPRTGRNASTGVDTMYKQHYSGQFSNRSTLRPCSPTRRNNPHPTKMFMSWRVPNTAKGGEENELLLETARQLRRDSAEGFYQEYKGVGKATPEQDDLLTRLTMAPPPLPSTSSSIYGMHDSSSFISRRPSLPGIAGGTSPDGTEADRVSRNSRHLSRTQPSHPPYHSRSLSENDAQLVKMNLRAQKDRQRTATEPVQAGGARLWKEPDIWHHRSERDHPPQVVHRQSVFATSRSSRGRHFRIHPEWPDLD